MEGQELFKVQDINSIIKMFAFSIQERFDEIDGIMSGDDRNRYLGHDSIDETQYLVRKYRNYIAYDQKEIKYLQKFVVRIIQIIEFFMQRSKNQHLLTYIYKKISDRLNKIVKSMPVDVQSLYSYIIELTKNGFSIKKTHARDRRYSLKKMDNPQKKTLQTNQDLIKETENQQPKQIKKPPTTANPAKRKRPASMSTKHGARLSTKENKFSLQFQIAKLYSILDIDQHHIQKIIENKDKIKIQKDSMKLNSSVLNAIQVYDKLYASSNHNLRKKEKIDVVLQEVNNRSVTRPLTNNWVSRKKKMSQYKKRKADYENFSFV